MPTNYIVKPGETISDVVLNSTGSILNWFKIIDTNEFESWTPALSGGQKIVIPDTIEIQSNVLRELQLYPAFNAGYNASEVKAITDNLVPPNLKLFQNNIVFDFQDNKDYLFNS